VLQRLLRFLVDEDTRGDEVQRDGVRLFAEPVELTEHGPIQHFRIEPLRDGRRWCAWSLGFVARRPAALSAVISATALSVTVVPAAVTAIVATTTPPTIVAGLAVTAIVSAPALSAIVAAVTAIIRPAAVTAIIFSAVPPAVGATAVLTVVRSTIAPAAIVPSAVVPIVESAARTAAIVPARFTGVTMPSLRGSGVAMATIVATRSIIPITIAGAARPSAATLAAVVAIGSVCPRPAAFLPPVARVTALPPFAVRAIVAAGAAVAAGTIRTPVAAPCSSSARRRPAVISTGPVGAVTIALPVTACGAARTVRWSAPITARRSVARPVRLARRVTLAYAVAPTVRLVAETFIGHDNLQEIRNSDGLTISAFLKIAKRQNALRGLPNR